MTHNVIKIIGKAAAALWQIIQSSWLRTDGSWLFFSNSNQ